MSSTLFGKPATPLRQSVQRRSRCNVVARSTTGTRLSLHMGETTVQFPFSRDNAEALNQSVLALLKTFADKQKAERPKRWEAMDFKFRGSPQSDDLERFEVFCNPNAHTSAFDAKVLITIKSHEGISVTTEGRLSNFKTDLDAYLSQ